MSQNGMSADFFLSHTVTGGCFVVPESFTYEFVKCYKGVLTDARRQKNARGKCCRSTYKPTEA